jgi:hypothetical protein
MKIQVTKRDGSQEVLTLTEPLTIFRSEHGNRLQTSTGMDHFFNLDGTYDGWGMPVKIAVPESHEGTCLPQEAKEFIQQIENGREFPEPPPPAKEKA